MDKYKKAITIVASILVGFVIGQFVHFSDGAINVGAVDCNSTTCFTTLGVTTSFTNDGTMTQTGALTLASTLTLPGNADVSSASATFTAATTTPCSIQSPFSATSTLVGYLVNITTSTSTGGTILADIGIDSTRYATTTIINGGNSIAQGAQASFSATTSPVVGASQWVVFKTGAGQSGVTYGGSCSGIFMQN